MAKSGNSKKGQAYRKLVWFIWIVFVLGVSSVITIFMLAASGGLGEMPTFERLENPQTNLATEIISSDGKTLGKFFLDDNRTDIGYSELPQSLVQALISTEDARFYDHSGIDFRGTLRAVMYLGTRGGASTITQQLAKQLFTGIAARGWERYTQKIKEWVIATRLERSYTKEEILTMYLNIYDFNYNADGIRSASRIYFGKEPAELKIEESAMLVGMLKNSSLYNPIRRSAITLDRRNTVLSQMAKYKYLSEQEKDSLLALPMEINFSPESHREGLATYFRMYLQGWLRDWIAANPKPAEPGERDTWNIYLDGLKVYTTIDSRMQENAEFAVQEHMKKLQDEFFVQNTPARNRTTPFIDLNPDEIKGIMERAMKNSERWRAMKRAGATEADIRKSFDEKTEMTVFDWNAPDQEKDTLMSPTDSIRYYKTFLRAAMLSMEPQSGHVKAWVGGINYRHFQYDNVIQGARQAGSTFKPFVYAAAIDQLRKSPCDSLPDTQYCIEANKHGNPEPWCPKNSDGKYSGKSYTLKAALANSVNTVTAQLIDMVGPRPVVALANNLGINREILEVPSIALGTPEINVYEMVGAYGAFANQGVYVKPVMVTRIEDRNGNVIFEYTPKTKDVFSKDVAYAMIDLMKGVTEGGSGIRLRGSGSVNNQVYKDVVTGYPYNFTNPIAGKTGTTQNQSDGWFMGMVPNLVTGVWVGGEDRATHFKGIAYGQGASMALPIWALYMRQNYQNPELGISVEDFEAPEELSIRVNCNPDPEDLNTQKARLEDDLEDFGF
jgi:penicillin-binding protein 1A